MAKRLAYKHLLLEALLATILVFAVMGLIALIPFNIKALDPVKEVIKNFRYSDVYYAELRSDHAAVDTTIVLVNIGTADRHKISRLLEAIAQQDPAVVGLDAFFPQREDSANTALAASFSQLQERLVAGSYLHETDSGEWHAITSDPAFKLTKAGYLNLVGEDSLNTTIRYFRPYMKAGETEYLSWSAQIVKAYHPDHFAKLLDRGGKTELIHYTGDYASFMHLELDEVIENPAAARLLKNKIVLLGHLGEYTGEKNSLEDLHFTPLNQEQLGRSKPDMYGLVIQANIISMILRGDYINEMAGWLELLLTFIICYVHVIVFIYFFVKEHLWYHPVAKVAQLITAALLLYLMLILYANANYSINTTLLLLGVVLSVDVLYLYEAIAVYLHKKRGVNSLFTQHH